MKEVFEVKMAKFRHPSLTKREIMRKYVEISEKALMRLVESDNCVKGALHRDKWTGKIYFKAYNYKPRTRLKDKLIRLLEHGWVKESVENIKFYESIPKKLGTARVMNVLDRETREAKESLIDRELIDFV